MTSGFQNTICTITITVSTPWNAADGRKITNKLPTHSEKCGVCLGLLKNTWYTTPLRQLGFYLREKRDIGTFVLHDITNLKNTILKWASPLNKRRSSINAASKKVAWISSDWFESFSPLCNDVTEWVITTRSNRMKFRLRKKLNI